MIPHKCPVCNGKGVVPGGFYSSVGDYGSSITTCRSCVNGIIWGPELPTSYPDKVLK